MSNSNKQRGAVSLFVVVFATLLITVVTVSFLRLMVHDQEQASTQDVSQSALDSAQAGVEDAKRALLRYQSVCQTSQTDCDTLNTAAVNSWSKDCNTAIAQLFSSSEQSTIDSDGEVKVQQTTGDISLDQAYTCVKVNVNTDDFLGTLAAENTKIIPIVGTSDFTTVEINWHTTDDLGVKASSNNFTVDLLNASDGNPLISQASWPESRPSILRVQLMQFGSNGFKVSDASGVSDFDNTTSNQSNANTLFLYPTGTTGTIVTGTPNTKDFIDRDVRKTPVAGPLAVTCSGKLSSGGYACRQRLTLPTPINGGTRTAFLRVTPYFRATHFSVSLLDQTGTVVQFKGVQPSIDSTGRTNNLFRRVETRVELIDNTFPYPDASVDITGNFCKDFAVTDVESGYQPSSTCNP